MTKTNYLPDLFAAWPRLHSPAGECAPLNSLQPKRGIRSLSKYSWRLSLNYISQ